MSDDTRLKSGIASIEAQMHRMLADDAVAYECAWNIWQTAMKLSIESPDVMHPLWLIWGALTDWVENQPTATEDAEREMRRAATEWFELDQTDKFQLTSYLDRWVFEEMGYQRKG